MIEDSLQKDMDSAFPEADEYIDGGTFETYSSDPRDTGTLTPEGDWDGLFF